MGVWKNKHSHIQHAIESVAKAWNTEGSYYDLGTLKALTQFASSLCYAHTSSIEYIDNFQHNLNFQTKEKEGTCQL